MKLAPRSKPSQGILVSSICIPSTSASGCVQEPEKCGKECAVLVSKWPLFCQGLQERWTYPSNWQKLYMSDEPFRGDVELMFATLRELCAVSPRKHSHETLLPDKLPVRDVRS